MGDLLQKVFSLSRILPFVKNVRLASPFFQMAAEVRYEPALVEEGKHKRREGLDFEPDIPVDSDDTIEEINFDCVPGLHLRAYARAFQSS